MLNADALDDEFGEAEMVSYSILLSLPLEF